MKVLFQNRQDVSTRGGGDAVQMNHTAGQLRLLGLDVDISTDAKQDLAGYDLVHLFNCFIVDTFEQAANARSQQVPYLISTIYVDGDYYNFANLDNPRIKLLRNLMGVRYGFPLHHAYSVRARRKTAKWQHTEQALRGAARLLPNSELEGRRIRQDFAVSTPYSVIPNGVDYDAYSRGNADRFRGKHDLGKYILCTGRLEAHKNQLMVIRAVAGTGLSLVCAGATLPKQREYRQECEREAKRLEVPLLIDDLRSVEDQADAYAGAEAHVLASWGETTGLVSLEAAAAGCPVVTTVRSPYQEYFDGLVQVCRPESVRSIRMAILRAPSNDTKRLQERVRTRFTWSQAAEHTREAYEKVLKLST